MLKGVFVKNAEFQPSNKETIGETSKKKTRSVASNSSQLLLHT